ncbi:MAG: Peptide methionine sulfoxide reductase MsrA [Phycisphaerae bacterium]|nr:Peptide methionine sulfoxide reductase MsrA [Phycisphaerae bacterium]
MKKRLWIISAAAASVAMAWLAGCQSNQPGGRPAQSGGESIAASEVSMGSNPTTRPDQSSMPPLSPLEKSIIVDKGTERPFTGQYWDFFKPGTYVCRRCGAPLYRSTDKFESECGWPSFDDALPGAVKRVPDADGMRTEIVCANCRAHLGHVFEGEHFTPKDTRHCVNSASMVFVPQGQPLPAETRPTPRTETAIFAGGCFWGVEHHFDRLPGVIEAVSGYAGGTTDNPTYRDVCTDKTGHAEAVRIVFDPAKVTYEQLARLFFEIHDPTTVDRQGPDVGTQYRSAVFCENDAQKQVVEKLIGELKANGYKVVTQVVAAGSFKFYPAEDYHQDYFVKHPGRYDCHVFVPRFKEKANP